MNLVMLLDAAALLALVGVAVVAALRERWRRASVLYVRPRYRGRWIYVPPQSLDAELAVKGARRSE